MNALNNMKIGTKLIGSFLLMALLLAGVAILGYFNMKTINSNMATMYENNLLPIEQLGKADVALYGIRGDDYKYILVEAERSKTEMDIQTGMAEFEKQIDLYNATVLTKDEETTLAELRKTWAEYKAQVMDDVAQVKAGNADQAIQDLLQGGKTSNARQALSANLDKLTQINVSIADQLSLDSNAIFTNSQNTLLVVAIIAVLLAIGLGILLSNSITGPLQKGVTMMQDLSLGRLGNRLRMERKDEIGVLARDMDVFADNLQNVVIATMRRIADGDLGVSITKKDEHDEIAPALKDTIDSIGNLITEMNNMSTLQDAGDLDAKIDVNRFKGAYRAMAQGVNDMVFGHITVKRKAMACVAEFGRGNFEAPLEKFPGKKVFINDTIEEVRENLKAISAETRMLSKAAVEGKLSTRANISKFKGDWCVLVQGMNDTLDSVIGPLNVAASYVDKIAAGVVPPPITDNYNGDFNTLKNNLNRMSDRLREMLTSISDAANNLSSATAEILAATTQQASGASEQSAAISQTTTTVEEVKASSEQAAMRAQDVATASQRTVEVARGGQTSVQATIESMGIIKERVEGISENLLALSDQTQQIGEIIAKVNEIASQSNMLALNASVEAARAGEHGKGFAVVATEVRSLAEQSRQATEQIKAILSEIQKATNSTVMATEEGVKGVDRGVQLSSQSREAIEQLSAVINESAQVAAQVVASGQQQQTGIDQISMAMQNINQVTMQSLASTRQTEKSAQNLNELARKMSEILAQYRF